MSAQLSIQTDQASGETAPAPEAAAAPKEPTEITTRQRLATLRLVREGSFPAPSGYPATDVPIRSPRDVFNHMEPYAEREACESFWILPSPVSVQVMYANASDTPSSCPVQYAQTGYESSFGQYVVDKSTRTVTHRYDGANVRSLLGQDVARRYELTGRRLVTRSARPDERWSVTWERY